MKLGSGGLTLETLVSNIISTSVIARKHKMSQPDAVWALGVALGNPHNLPRPREWSLDYLQSSPSLK